MLFQIDPDWLFVTNACLVALFGIMYGKKTAEHADRKLLKDLVDSLQAQKPGSQP